MFKELLLIAFTASVASAMGLRASQMCDPDPHLGCYNQDPPWNRPFIPLPLPSSTIQTKFYLYVRGHTDAQTLDYNNPSSISGSRFNGNRDTKIISHGFNSDSTSQWMHDMKDQFLIHADFNVILVDWGKGAITIDYQQATANTRVVGDQVGELVKALPTTKSRVHITGHSLGAHIASFGSRRAGLVGRVSGLDPADPNYQGEPNAAKLDKSDADFVDVIHSDAEPFVGTDGFGTHDISGDLDFWPNGGLNQPACDGLVACDHGMSHDYYVESINSACNFFGYPCANYDKFKAGQCYNCLGNPCPIMGYRAAEFKNNYYHNMQLYLKTGNKKPYCLSSYKIVLQTGLARFAGTNSNIFVRLIGEFGESEVFKFSNAGRHRGAIDKYMIESSKPLGEIKNIRIWQDDTSFAFGGWNLNNVLVMYEKSQLTFCANKWIAGLDAVTLHKC